MENDESAGNGKKRFSIYIPEATIDMAKKWHEADNCGSVSEYVRRAIEFYSGYVASEHNPSYLPRIVISTLQPCGSGACGADECHRRIERFLG